MNPASEDIASILEAESSLGLTWGTNLFIGREPDQPSNCVTLFDLPGRSPMLTMKKAESRYYYSEIMVRVRNIGYKEAWDLSFAILQFLHGEAEGGLVINGTNYMLIQAQLEPQLLNYDQNNRGIMITNYNIQRKE